MAVDHPSYLGFFGDVKIHDVITKEVIRFAHPLYPFVSGLSVVIHGADSQLSQISLNFDAPFIEGQALLNSTIFNNKNLVEVQLGYPEGLLSKPYYGILHNGGIGLELTPEGLTGAVTANALSRSAFYESTFTSTSLQEAYEQAARQGGQGVEFSPGATAQLEKFKNHKVQGSKSSQQVLDEIEMIANLVFENTADKNGLLRKVMSEIEQSGNPPKRRFVMRGQFDGATNTYPILSYGPELQAAQFSFHNPGEKGLFFSGINIAGSLVVDSALPSETEQKAGKSDNPDGDASDETAKTEDGKQIPTDQAVDEQTTVTSTMPVGGDVDDALRMEAIRSLQDRIGVGGGWKATIVTVGIPDIQPFETIEVVGVGALFDGIYQIWSVTHNQSIGNWETTLNCWCLTIQGVGGVNDQSAA